MIMDPGIDVEPSAVAAGKVIRQQYTKEPVGKASVKAGMLKNHCKKHKSERKVR